MKKTFCFKFLLAIIITLSFNVTIHNAAAETTHDAIDRYRAITKENPESVEAQCNLADAYIRKYQKTSEKKYLLLAKMAAIKVLNINPDSPLPHLSMARLFIALNKSDKALDHAQKAIGLDPGNAEARQLLKELGGKVAENIIDAGPQTAPNIPAPEYTKPKGTSDLIVNNSLTPEKRKAVKIEGKEALPLRILTRPFSNVYTEKDNSKGTVMENVPSFQSFFVYTKPSSEDIELGDAWYEVGTDNLGTVVGWMRYDDVFEWKQTMCLAYTHPEGRKQVLMFERKSYLKGIIESSSDDRTKNAEELYTAIDSRDIPQDFPVISIEPKKAVDISKQFYLLPILDFQTIEIDGREGRLLKLAAVTGTREKSDIRVDNEFLDDALGESTRVDEKTLKQLTVDLVWVMDTTVSMRPHIAQTLDVVNNASTQITQDKELTESIHFGIWGYRDNLEAIPDIGYTTKNYSPALLTIDKFKDTLAMVKVTTTDSVDYEEDVFSGMNDAIYSTKWSPNAMRLIVLVADAPGHELGHEWNLSKSDENTLHELAKDNNIYIIAIHIKEPRAGQYHEKAETQFLTLSRNEGQGVESAYYDIPSDNIDAFHRVTTEFVAKISKLVYSAKKGTMYDDTTAKVAEDSTSKPIEVNHKASGEMAFLNESEGSSDKTSPKSSLDVKKDIPKGEMAFLEEAETITASGEQFDSVIKAALVKWIGIMSEAQSPSDIVAWAVDKDLVEPAIQSMEVRLLINKRQLDSLKTVLSDVMSAGRRGQIGGENFFDALQATAATAARNPDKIINAKAMAQTGLIPEFLEGLPYKSKLMDMSNELWFSWSVDEQFEFLNELDAKIHAYLSIHDTPEGWIQLNKGDDPDEHVYPISLELLP